METTDSKREKRLATTREKAKTLFRRVEAGGQGYVHTNHTRPLTYLVHNPNNPQSRVYIVDCVAQTCDCPQFLTDGECKHLHGMNARIAFARHVLHLDSLPQEESGYRSCVMKKEDFD